MDNSSSKIVFDEKLKIEVLTLEGMIENLPPHFHDYYELGYIESGSRRVLCQGKEYIVGKNDLLLFNPNDNHTCLELEKEVLNFRCFHITTKRMEELALECIGYALCPYFEPQIVYKSDLIPQIKELIDLINNGSYCDLQKEELLYMIIGDLIEDYSQQLECEQMEISDSVERACEYIERHYATNISLCDLSSFTGFSKYHFIRMFTREKGISPYRYIESIKMTEAKKLLKAGEDLLDITYQLGFSSQSHFTNFFKKYARVTPKQYSKQYNA